MAKKLVNPEDNQAMVYIFLSEKPSTRQELKKRGLDGKKLQKHFHIS